MKTLFSLMLESTVKQKLKSFPKEKLEETKKRATQIVKYNFQFDIEEKIKSNLISWVALQLLNNAPPNFINDTRDYISDKINTINFNDPTLTYQDVINNSRIWHDQLANNTQIGRKGRIGFSVINFPDGFKWVDINRGYCPIEASAMGHCGNVASQYDDKIFSLRDNKNVPYLTFIINNGVLGEAKGRFNNKPEKKFHKYIAELLKRYVKFIFGGGYQPENNFEFDDLSPSLQKEVLKSKPNINNPLSYAKQQDYLDFNLAYKILEFDAFNKKQYNYQYTNDYNYSKNKFTPQQFTTDEEYKELVKNAKSILSDRKMYLYKLELVKSNRVTPELIKNVSKELRLDSPIDYEVLKIIKNIDEKSFYQIYDKLHQSNKSQIVVYFVATNTPFDPLLFYHLGDYDSDSVVDQLTKMNVPIPERLQIARQSFPQYKIGERYIVKFDYSREDFDEIGQFIVSSNNPIDPKLKNYFNKMSLISAEQLKKILPQPDYYSTERLLNLANPTISNIYNPQQLLQMIQNSNVKLNPKVYEKLEKSMTIKGYY